MLINITGASGSGKSAITEELTKRLGGRELCSFTTRLPRFKGEKGKIFVDKNRLLRALGANCEEEVYEKLKSNNNVIASTLYDGNLYWAELSQIEDIYTTDVLYVVDIPGIKELKEKLEGKIPMINIGITVDSHIKLVRLMNQTGRTPQNIRERIQVDAVAFATLEENVDYLVENNSTMEDTLETILGLITDAKRRV